MARGLVQAAALVVLVSVLPSANAAGASVRVVWAQPTAVGTLPSAHINHELQTVDLDGDGLRDVIIGALIFQRIQPVPPVFLRNRGNGRFEDVSSSIFDGPAPALEWNRKQIVADFDGDGRPDLFFADHGTDNPAVNPGLPGQQNRLVLSTAGGKLRDATGNLPPHRSFTHSAAAADVNGDGAIDIFENNLECCGRDRTPPQLLMNDGTGRFTAAPGRLHGLPRNRFGKAHTYACAFADVNSDRSPDLVLGGNEQVERSVVLLNNGRGEFTYSATLPPKLYPPTTGIVIEIASADVNGDGASDLLMAETQNDPYYIGSRVQILRNDGRGGFVDETATRLPEQPAGRNWPNHLLLEDVNDDRALDLAVQFAPVGIVPEVEQPLIWLNVGGVFRRITGPAHGSPPHLRGPVGFVDGAGPHALFSVDSNESTRASYYVSRQIVAPAAPAGVRTRSTRRGVVVSWRAVRDAARYEITRNGARAGTSRATSFLDPRALRGVRYRYSVRAVNAVGAGPFSRPVVGSRR